MGFELLVTEQPLRDANVVCGTISTATRLSPAQVLLSDNGGCDEPAEGSRKSHSRFAGPWGRKRAGKETTPKEYGPTNLSILHQSQTPLIDIIFVHGLRGGSVKTWQKGGDAQRFWPKLWLPSEPGFEHANIHAFGYDANWDSEKGDIFKIQDFGRQLMEEMRTSPELTDDPTRPIIMLGHSMGGLAFIIAQESEEWRDRMKSIFFLATPHRGSKYASILNSIFTISRIAPSRQYIGDLAKDSPSLKAIHDDFIAVAGKIVIYSFYETLKMKIGPSSAYIVERESAVLGLPNEHVKYANATHCDISKYTVRSDPTYIAVRNSLAQVTKDIIWQAETVRTRSVASQMAVIRTYLGVEEPPIERREVSSGSCQWIQAREDFRRWQLSGSPAELHEGGTHSAKDLSLFWVFASPGSGKSFLASYVQEQLEESESQVAYYYFHLGRNDSRSLAPLLRTIAYQMAIPREDVRGKMYEMSQDGSRFDIDDTWTIWVKLFKKCILQLASQKPFFWVIDALDECERYSDLFNMLKGEEVSFPLRIFITSRPMGDVPRLHKMMALRASTTCIKIPHEDTMSDIRSYIMHRVAEGCLGSATAAESLADSILQKSNGCFLWVRLVLDQLENTHTAEGKIEVLEELPEGMKPIYQRSVEFIAANKRETHVSRTLLSWIIAGTRQMSLDELAEALQHDAPATIEKTEQEISELCGQLAVVKTESNAVELIHPTAREFLLSSAGLLTISEPEAHARIALVCLKVMSGAELHPPRTQRALMLIRPCLSPLLRYAVESFSEHVLASLPRNDEEILSALEKLFKINILGWIEKIAAGGNCHAILRVSRNLTTYLDRRASTLPRSPKTAKVFRWATDLSRLVTKFGEPLLKQPSSIYFLIPPMCPENSAIAQVPRRPTGGLVLGGSSGADWDDCAAHVNLGDGGASAVSSGEENLIIGTDFGAVTVFNHKTYQREATFNHGGAIDLVYLADKAIVICTTRAIILQDLRGDIIWQNRLRFRCLCVTVTGSRVTAVVSHGHVMRWSKATGEILQDEKLEHQGQQPKEANRFVRKGAPIYAKISLEFEMIALGYSDGCVCLWDAEDLEFIGCIKDEQGRLAKELLFNPNKNIQLLLVVYDDYGLSTFDTWTTEVVQSHSAPVEAAFLSAACSPDGHTLATADSQGNITLWSFEQLKIVGNIRTSSSVYKILSFTVDGSGILDITDSSIKCWTPVAVSQHALAQEEPLKDTITKSDTAPQSHWRDKDQGISVIVTHPELALTVTGNHTGDVLGFSVHKTDVQKQSLYNHNASVLHIALCRTGLIASYDSNKMIVIGKYDADTGLTTRLNGADGAKAEAHVTQLCFSSNDRYLLLGMDTMTAVYRCDDARCVGRWHSDNKDANVGFWMAAQAPESSQEQFWVFSDHKVKRFSAKNFPQAIEPSEILLEYNLAPGCQEREIAKAVLLAGAESLSLQVNFWTGMIESSTVLVFQLKEDGWGHPGEETRTISNTLPGGSRHWQHFLGWKQDTARIIFMDRDSWICSADIGEIKKRECQRHFYLPRHLLASNVSPALTATGDVVLANGSELMSISGGFNFGYPATFS